MKPFLNHHPLVALSAFFVLLFFQLVNFTPFAISGEDAIQIIHPEEFNQAVAIAAHAQTPEKKFDGNSSMDFLIEEVPLSELPKKNVAPSMLENLMKALKKNDIHEAMVIVLQQETKEHVALVIPEESKFYMLIMDLDPNKTEYEINRAVPIGNRKTQEYDEDLLLPEIPGPIQMMVDQMEEKQQIIIYIPDSGSTEYHILPALT